MKTYYTVTEVTFFIYSTSLHYISTWLNFWQYAERYSSGLHFIALVVFVSNISLNWWRGYPQAPGIEERGVSDDMVATVTSAVIKEIVRYRKKSYPIFIRKMFTVLRMCYKHDIKHWENNFQFHYLFAIIWCLCFPTLNLIQQLFLFHCSQDTEGKILPTADANANNPIVTNIASQIVQKIMR